MADDNIFQQYLRPPKSVMEYTAEYDAADARKQSLRQNALELAAGQQKYSDGVQSRQRADQLRQALMGLPQGATDDQRIQAMRGTASPEGFAAADALDKSLIERRKGTAAADKDDAETAKTKLAQIVTLHNFQSQKLATVQSPEDALPGLMKAVHWDCFLSQVNKSKALPVFRLLRRIPRLSPSGKLRPCKADSR